MAERRPRKCRAIEPPSTVTPPSESDHWRQAIHVLAAFDRPSASDGERRAAEWIAERLNELGCPARVEEERAHGGYWWPLALVNAVGAAGGVLALRRRGRVGRAVAALAGAAAATAAWDDVTGRGFRFRSEERRVGKEC